MKKPNGSRFAIVMQLKKVVREAIPRLQSFEEANALETQLFRMRSNKIITDKEFVEYSEAIKSVCILHGWITDDQTADQSAAAPT